MKKIVLLLFVASTIVFAGCEDGTNGGNNGGGSNSTYNITIPNLYGDASALTVIKAAIAGTSDIVLAETNYASGNLTLKLPAVPEDRVLSLVATGLPGGLTLDNRNAKWTGHVRMLPYIGNKVTGNIEYLVVPDENTNILVRYAYTTQDFTLDGKFMDGTVWIVFDNFLLKKGWNSYPIKRTFENGVPKEVTYYNGLPTGLVWAYYPPPTESASQPMTFMSACK